MPANDRPPTSQNSHGGKREGAGRPPGAHGRGATLKDVRELARRHSEEALMTIVKLMEESEDGWLVLECAKTIIDWAFGKPRDGRVVELEDRLTMQHPTIAELEAAVVAEGIPLDRLRRPKLIER